MLLVAAAVAVTVALQTIPGNISKVPRFDANICNASGSLSQLQAGVAYEMLVLIDDSHLYRYVNVFLKELFGVVHVWSIDVPVMPPACPSGTVNAWQRPHLMPLKVIMPGIYELETVLFNDATHDGTIVARERIVVVR